MNLDSEHAIAELLAERSITRIIHQYAHAADRGDITMMEGCFWPDAEVDLGAIYGPASDFLDGWRPNALDPSRVSRHFLGNILIEVNLTAQIARAESYCIGGSRVRDENGVLVDRLAHVRYVDRFEQRNDEWRIHRRVAAFDWATVIPVTGTDLLQPGYVRGVRGPDDVWEHILEQLP